MLLTTEPMSRNRKVLWWMVQTYLTRWRVEDTIRFIKQSYNVEDISVLTYERLKNVAALVLAAAFFTAVQIGCKPNLQIWPCMPSRQHNAFSVLCFGCWHQSYSEQIGTRNTSPKNSPGEPNQQLALLLA